MQDRKDVAQRVAMALDAAGDRLRGLGVSEVEIGRAMLASGLSRLLAEMPANSVAEHLMDVGVSIFETSDDYQKTLN